MSLSSLDLADSLATSLGKITTTDQVKAFAKGIVDELTNDGTATFNNFATPHPITGMTEAGMSTIIKDEAVYPDVSAELLGFCSGIVDHIQDDGFVTYTGPDTGDPPNDWFLGGTINGLDGATLANLVMIGIGKLEVTAELLAFCTAICTYIMTNAEVVSGVIS